MVATISSWGAEASWTWSSPSSSSSSSTAATLRVRTTETALAIDALTRGGYLAPEQAELLRDGYAFLRKLEQRIRILHASAAHLLEESAPGLLPLARRMGIRDRRGSEAAAELIARYRAVTERVRATYDAIVEAEVGHLTLSRRSRDGDPSP
jgi:glutamine synthetase adenylyltransferase